jgi:hypothetical protein
MTTKQSDEESKGPQYKTGLEGMFNMKPEDISPPTTEEAYLNRKVKGSPYKVADVVAVGYAVIQEDIFSIFSPRRTNPQLNMHFIGLTKRGIQESELPELKQYYTALKNQKATIDLAEIYCPKKEKKQDQGQAESTTQLDASTYVKTIYEELGGAAGPNGEKRVLVVNVYDLSKPFRDMFGFDPFRI